GRMNSQLRSNKNTKSAFADSTFRAASIAEHAMRFAVTEAANLGCWSPMARERPLASLKPVVREGGLRVVVAADLSARPSPGPWTHRTNRGPSLPAFERDRRR